MRDGGTKAMSQREKRQRTTFDWVSAEIMNSAGMTRNCPECLKWPEMAQNLTQGGIDVFLVPVCILIRDIPIVLAGTEWNQ